jgi:hypothetical protein
MENHDNHCIHPEDRMNLQYWTKKWGVSIRELNDAILYTGSLNTIHVREYLKKDSWLYHPTIGIKEVSRQIIRFLF